MTPGFTDGDDDGGGVGV
jgi:hypothetical protein